MVLVGLHPNILSGSQLILSNQLVSLFFFFNEEIEAHNKILSASFVESRAAFG